MTEEEKVRRDKRRAELDAIEANEHLRRLLETYGGRYVVWHEIAECGVYTGSFRGEETHWSAFAEGKRAVGLSLINKVFTADPNAYAVMRSENEAREAKRREQERAEHDDYTSS